MRPQRIANAGFSLVLLLGFAAGVGCFDFDDAWNACFEQGRCTDAGTANGDGGGVPDAGPSNLLRNASFEEALSFSDNWDNMGLPDYAVARSGTKSLRVTGPQVDAYMRQIVTPALPGDYWLGVWVKGSGDRGSSLRYSEEVRVGIQESDWEGNATEWKPLRMGITMNTDAGDGFVDVQFSLDAGESMWVDDALLCSMLDPRCNEASVP